LKVKRLFHSMVSWLRKEHFFDDYPLGYQLLTDNVKGVVE